MGETHALSAIAFYLLLLAFVPDFVYMHILQTKDILIVIASVFVIVGFALFPDFDNTRSTVISVFGLLGVLISKAMRGSAILIYEITRTKFDDDKANPHRGFWHTLISSVVIGLIVLLTTSIHVVVTIPILNKPVTIGYLFAIFYIYICFKLTLTVFFKSQLKKLNFFGTLILTIVGIAFSASVLLFSPGTLDYRWIGGLATLGYIFHIIGDTMTVSGTPLLFPIVHKRKRWWMWRLTKIKAGGAVEQAFILPSFGLICVLCLIKIIFLK